MEVNRTSKYDLDAGTDNTVWLTTSTKGDHCLAINHECKDQREASFGRIYFHDETLLELYAMFKLAVEELSL